MKPVISLLIALFVASNCLAATSTLEGEIVSIADGDTVTLLDAANNQIKIRLAQIDSPEIGHGTKRPGQPFGQNSKRSLSDLVFHKHVTAECETKDRYGRQVCKLLVDGQDANIEQVRRGMAWVYRKYAHNPEYFQVEDQAREAGLGLWSDENRIEPWEWRHR